MRSTLSHVRWSAPQESTPRFRREARGPVPLPRRRGVLRQLVADDPAALHDEPDALQLGNIRERVAGDRDDIGIFALFDRSDVILPAERLGVDDSGGLDRARGAHMRLL